MLNLNRKQRRMKLKANPLGRQRDYIQKVPCKNKEGIITSYKFIQHYKY